MTVDVKSYIGTKTLGSSTHAMMWLCTAVVVYAISLSHNPENHGMIVLIGHGCFGIALLCLCLVSYFWFLEKIQREPIRRNVSGEKKETQDKKLVDSDRSGM